MAKNWYLYNGPTPSTPSDQLDVTNYIYSAADLILLGVICPGGREVCAVLTNGTSGIGGIPTSPLSANIQLYLANGLASGMAEPQPPQKPNTIRKPI